MGLNIEHFKQEIKHFVSVTKKELFSVFIILFVGISCFCLGRLSAEEIKGERGDVKIESSGLLGASAAGIPKEKEPPAKVVEETSDKSTGEEVVASKSGKKYHYPWCAGAKQIAEKNKITFKNIGEARSAGYLPASNCKGLK